MGFFDFNVPYESTPNTSGKTTRIKLAVKAMELGYVGIAYNHTIRGVMSDKDRCSIPLLSLSNLLAHAPSLSSSVNLHRDLLNIPRTTPFRQYTRLTVWIESPGQSQTLNSGNPILKTYDLIAVRPVNQIAFDHACEKAEVNIIAIDFSRNLPFRLKQHMVKAAMERGVYFEITYSHLIADVQARRQMISNAQLLVDWTGGKNLILTSAASSVTELRGPYDVANLSSLLGLSKERAKAAISKNCRNLITTALRKRHFYKEAVRVEQLPSDEKSKSNKPSYLDWLKWDPISSGEGDLQLDDTTKSAATPTASKTVKAVSAASVVDSIPSNVVKKITTTAAIEVPAVSSELSEKSGGLDLLPEAVQTSLSNSPARNQSESREVFANDNQIRIATNMADKETRTPMSAMAEETKAPTNLKNSDVSDTLADSVETERHGFQQRKGISSCEINVTLSNEDMIHQPGTVDNQSDTACAMDVEVEVLPENINLAPQIEKSLTLQDSDVVLDAENATLNEDVMEIDLKDQEDAPTTHNDSGEQPREPGDATVAVLDHIPLSVTPDMKIEDASSVTKHKKLKHLGDIYSKSVVVLDGDLETKEKRCSQSRPFSLDGATVKIDKREAETGTEMDHATLGSSLSDGATKEGEKHEVEADSKMNRATFVPSISGKVRARQKRPHQPLLFPFKRLLNPVPFKRSSKSKRRTEMS